MLDLLSKTGKFEAKPCSSPMAPGVHLIREGETFEDLERYRRLVGILNYLIVTCPNIAHLVSVVSRYMSAPTIDHGSCRTDSMLFERSSKMRYSIL